MKTAQGNKGYVFGKLELFCPTVGMLRWPLLMGVVLDRSILMLMDCKVAPSSETGNHMSV